uniref:Uncharacterized protein n=1 Tax=Sphaerodactylus townsendi TaxID=933632 RepID=A0ACB8EYN3_9SAUR
MGGGESFGRGGAREFISASSSIILLQPKYTKIKCDAAGLRPPLFFGIPLSSEGPKPQTMAWKGTSALCPELLVVPWHKSSPHKQGRKVISALGGGRVYMCLTHLSSPAQD